MTTTTVEGIDRRLLSRVSNRIRCGKDHTQGLLDPVIVDGSKALKHFASQLPKLSEDDVEVQIVRAGLSKAFPDESLNNLPQAGEMLVRVCNEQLKFPELDPIPRFKLRRFSEFMGSTPPENFAQRRQ